jgi:hypothetical protein
MDWTVYRTSLYFIFSEQIPCITLATSRRLSLLPPSSSSMSKQPHRTIKESYRLTSKQDGWNLPGGTVTASRTRHAGSGRPRLFGKRDPNVSSSDSDSEYEEESIGTSEEDLIEDDECDDEDDSDVGEEEDQEKPPASRALLELSSLKKLLEKNSRCPECSGPVEMKVNTICIASSVMLCCKDQDCGLWLH